MATSPKLDTEQRRRLLYERVVFWVVMPLGLAIIRVLMAPDDTVTLRMIFLIYLFAVILFGWLIFHVLTQLVTRFLAPQSWRDMQNSVLPGIAVLCIGNLLGNMLLFPTRPLRADLFCLFAQQIEAACYVLPPTDFGWALVGHFFRVTLISMAYWLMANYFVASLFNTPRYGFRISHLKAPPQQAPATVDVEASPLLSRLPYELGDDVILLAANQHYLDVHTRKGNALVLYRLSDAVTELGDRGVQIHRSYWVAYDAIRAIEKDGAALLVVLENGQSFPVSRGYRNVFKSGKFQRMQLS